MVVEAKRTVIIPLGLSAGTAHLPHATYNKYNHCQNPTSDHCWNEYDYDECITSKQQAEPDLYHDLRDDTNDLHANLVQKAIKDATGAVDSAVETWKDGDRCSRPE